MEGATAGKRDNGDRQGGGLGGLRWLGDRGGLGRTIRDACWPLRSLTSFVTTSQLAGWKGWRLQSAQCRPCSS